MKLKNIIAIGAAALITAIPALADSTSTPAASATPAAAQKYTCTMHPEIVQDKPGKCPKCGMKLVPKADSGKSK